VDALELRVEPQQLGEVIEPAADLAPQPTSNPYERPPRRRSREVRGVDAQVPLHDLGEVRQRRVEAFHVLG
jgi:hypothetical protein